MPLTGLIASLLITLSYQIVQSGAMRRSSGEHGPVGRHRSEPDKGPMSELEHRGANKEQVFGSAYANKRLEVTARYEVHLARKLERTLAKLIRLREPRSAAISARSVWQ